MSPYLDPRDFRELAERQATFALVAPTPALAHVHAAIAAHAFIHSLWRWRGPAVRWGDPR